MNDNHNLPADDALASDSKDDERQIKIKFDVGEDILLAMIVSFLNNY